jgi:phospholipase/carboxylesterase
MENIDTLQFGNFTLRLRVPAKPGPHPLILMLHGWTGDENSMWIFSSRLPKDALLLAPRGFYPTTLGGFGWHVQKPDFWPQVEDFLPAMDRLFELLGEREMAPWDGGKISLVGFSQGAALAGAMALKYPERVNLLAMLSGFLPEDAPERFAGETLADLPVFMAHGRTDELVPVARARQAAAFLEKAGGRVFYCEEDVGHKLSASCFKALQVFFEEN